MSEQNSELKNPTLPLYYLPNYLVVSSILPENPQTFITTYLQQSDKRLGLRAYHQNVSLTCFILSNTKLDQLLESVRYTWQAHQSCIKRIDELVMVISVSVWLNSFNICVTRKQYKQNIKESKRYNCWTASVYLKNKSFFVVVLSFLVFASVSYSHITARVISLTLNF